jgi:REP element-mobilizing transposase RayT
MVRDASQKRRKKTLLRSVANREIADMAEVLAYHVIFCTHGFWLPNDPRGSQSTVVRASSLKAFGPATPTGERDSVAHRPHDVTKRHHAKQELVYPEVIFDGHQALSVAHGFAVMTAKSGYAIHACAILPSHVHLVVARHRYPIEQVVRLLRQEATRQLLADGRHPFAAQRHRRPIALRVGTRFLEGFSLHSRRDSPENCLRRGEPDEGGQTPSTLVVRHSI